MELVLRRGIVTELLPKGFDCWARDVARIAKDMDSKAIFKFTQDLKLYVYVEHVVIPGSPQFLFGLGSTFDDACQDYMRKIRGVTIKHAISDKEGNYV
jgi:hypothetical protein